MYVASCMLNHVPLFTTLWTLAHQAPLSMGFSRQEYWSGLPFSPPGDIPNPGIKPMSPEASALADVFFTTEPPGKPFLYLRILQIRLISSLEKPHFLTMAKELFT